MEIEDTMISWGSKPDDLVKHFQDMIDQVVIKKKWNHMQRELFIDFLTKQRMIIEDWMKRKTRDLVITGVEE